MSNAAERVALEARGVARGGAVWSFALRAGGAVWIPNDDAPEGEWLDWLTGIEWPGEGEVFWQGGEWRQLGAAAAARERGRIGCVFADGGLVANLDMDENVWLPARIHRWEGAGGQIEEWARFFGCWPLSSERAPVVGERLRRRLLWTRAFAGRPAALILEHPLVEASAEDCELLFEGIRRAREWGCAVVWLDRELPEETRAALAPLTRAEARPQA